MFDNAGEKIKAVAKPVFIIGTVVAECIGLIMLVAGLDHSDILTLCGIVTMAVGPLLFWLMALVTYGFGEIVDTAIMNRGLVHAESEFANMNEEPMDLSNTSFVEKSDFWKCLYCQADLYVSESGDVLYCPHCQQRFAFMDNGGEVKLAEI